MSDILRRRTLRVAFSVQGPMAGCRPPALLGSLVSVFERAGAKVALGSERRPRPMARLAYPLPLGVEGLEEWADVALEADAAEPALGALRAHCPEGLDVLHTEQVPHRASPIDELVEAAHWAWSCPDALFADAAGKMGAFEASVSFLLAKTGKLDGHKGAKSIEVRPLVLGLAWEGRDLRFSTSVVQGHALNPQKLLAAILGTGAEAPGALRRLRLDMRDDPRLLRHDKYAHKLKNLYEDAVLLEPGPSVRVLDDEDDEVLSI
jgi:radical SAM-linked protein